MSLPVASFDYLTNASVHRSVNERHLADALAASGGSMQCECECDRAECASGFEVTLMYYNAVRSEGCRFIVAPGHQGVGDSMVAVAPRYSVIDKVGQQRLLAEALAPR